MDAQIKKGLLEYCVLAQLRQKESYGYQIIRDISAYIELSESTLYPILRRLETEHYVDTYTVEYHNRLRKYYRITAHGQQHLDAFASEQDELLRVIHFISGKE
ncbi:MAG: PadR family transcriptional regulator [Clostridiales bacterium]|nr:PadR family transcriptional regulator [Clostridiales bacterium]